MNRVMPDSMHPRFDRLHRLAALLFCCLPMAVQAIDPAVPAERLQRSDWSQAAGAPALIRQLTQTHDGFLWMSAVGGLVRFDGVTFDRVTKTRDGPLPSGAIAVLS